MPNQSRPEISRRNKTIAYITATVVAITALLLVILHHNPLADPQEELTKKILAVSVVTVAYIAFMLLYARMAYLPIELWQNRKLIWKLAKNDFKTRYAGSYMGRIWAFIQPVVTVALYYFVFEVVFQSRAQLVASGVKASYVMWLTAGLVPWLYFTEALTNGTNALISYNYLVKKVVFKISILPIIKMISATFIHIFFVAVMLIMYFFIYGYRPDVYVLQVFYYSFCTFAFSLSLSYSTCAIVVFFRDLNQIIGIVLQIGMWATPILWSLTLLSENHAKFSLIFRLNPLYYVVNGYRACLFNNTWFWQDFYTTVYFWVVTAIVFGIGCLIFKKLKPHFADIL